jgi:hypothetical protein
MTPGWWVQEDSDEGFDLSRTRPKYSVLLEEEDYETDDDLVPGFDKGPEENYGGVACDSWGAVETWDPWEPSYFFLLK